jgi:hypothetical protein
MRIFKYITANDRKTYMYNYLAFMLFSIAVSNTEDCHQEKDVRVGTKSNRKGCGRISLILEMLCLNSSWCTL